MRNCVEIFRKWESEQYFSKDIYTKPRLCEGLLPNMKLLKKCFYNIRYEKRWERAKKIIYKITQKIEWSVLISLSPGKGTNRNRQSHIKDWGKWPALIEKIITKAHDEQHRNLLNIIKGHFEILKQQLPELKKEINELRKSIEHAKNVLEDRIAPAEEKLRNIESPIQLLLKIN